MRFATLAIVVIIVGGVQSAAAQSTCAVQGVWNLESVTVDGKPEPLGQRRQQKIVTQSHFMFISQAPGANGAKDFGAGSYRVSGNKYSEHLDFFYDPQYLNRDLQATCGVAGGKWTHAFEWVTLKDGKETGRSKVVEIWRKVE